MRLYKFECVGEDAEDCIYIAIGNSLSSVSKSNIVAMLESSWCVDESSVFDMGEINDEKVEK